MPGRRKPSDMQHMPLEAQQEHYQRFLLRRDLLDLNRRLSTIVLSWTTDHPMTDKEFLEIFYANGHYGEYHEFPSETTFRRVMDQAEELSNLIKRVQETPMNYSGALELSYAYQRAQLILDKLALAPRDTMQQAIAFYRQIGEAIRERVFQETGHYPEEFPTPIGRITGNENPRLFQPVDYQPPLFPEEQEHD